MASRPEAVLLGLPFSHFCQKAEWGLTQAGIPYEYRKTSLWRMKELARIHAGGTVPVLRVGARLLCDSHDILVWADEHRKPGSTALYPEGMAKAVADWEKWADEDVGPVSRREAYRALHTNPALAGHYDVPWWYCLNAAKRLYLAVLKHYKVRRFEAEDDASVRLMVERVRTQLESRGTGYLLAEHPTAADITVAALMAPMLPLAGARGYEALPGWIDAVAFVDRVRPKRTSCVRARRFGKRESALWARLGAVQARAP